jgi:hypothetical protein
MGLSLIKKMSSPAARISKGPPSQETNIEQQENVLYNYGLQFFSLQKSFMQFIV